MAGRFGNGKAFKRAIVELPELGQVHLRCLSARVAVQLAELSPGAASDQLDANNIKLLELVLRGSVCDEAGELVFAKPEDDPLEHFSIEQAKALCAKAVELVSPAGGMRPEGTPPNAGGGPSAA